MSSKNKSPLRKFQTGVLGIITEIVTSFIFSFLLTLFAKDQAAGSDVVVAFILMGFVGSIGLMFFFQNRGFVFLIGWLITAWLLRGLFSPFYFAVYFAAPIVALVLRTLFFFRKTAKRARIF